MLSPDAAISCGIEGKLARESFPSSTTDDESSRLSAAGNSAAGILWIQVAGTSSLTIDMTSVCLETSHASSPMPGALLLLESFVPPHAATSAQNTRMDFIAAPPKSGSDYIFLRKRRRGGGN